MIAARKGEFETGFERGGQTREHAQLAKTLGVSKLIVVVNKMDDPSVKWSKERWGGRGEGREGGRASLGLVSDQWSQTLVCGEERHGIVQWSYVLDVCRVVGCFQGLNHATLGPADCAIAPVSRTRQAHGVM